MSTESSPLVEPPPRPQLQVPKPLVYVATVLVCLLSASFTVFSLYTEPFHDQLGYTTLQNNIISIAGEAGLYVVVPALGYIADTYRLSYLGYGGGALFVAGYLAAGWTYANKAPYGYMALSFVLIGIATSAVYICALVNCARLYPRYAVLAISVPTTAYGLSSLLFSQTIAYALDTTTSFGIVQVYNVLAVVLFFVGMLAGVLPQLGKVDVTEVPALTRSEQGEVNEIARSHFHRFVHDRETWMLLLSFVLVSGPLEMYLNNLGVISHVVRPSPSTATQVSLFSTFSTVSRLVVGASTDLLGHRIAPTTMLVSVLLLLGGAHVVLAAGWFGPQFSVSSILNGFAYGSAFTLYPIIITQVWGVEGFATYWGMFISGPALGSLLFGLEFALDYQHTGGFSLTFWTSAIGMLCSALIVYKLADDWVKRSLRSHVFLD